MRSRRFVAVATALSAVLLSSSCKTSEGGSGLKDGEDSQSAAFAHELKVAGDPLFASTGFEKPQWTKFAIDLSQPDKVWFQNSNTYPFHFDFATKHLPGWIDARSVRWCDPAARRAKDRARRGGDVRYAESARVRDSIGRAGGL